MHHFRNNSQDISSDNSSTILQRRYQILKYILSYSEISPMPTIIKDFKSVSDSYLLQLVKEIEIYRLSSDERSQLLNFLDYFHSVTREIKDIYAFHLPN